jgi:hypothetical protein
MFSKPTYAQMTTNSKSYGGAGHGAFMKNKIDEASCTVGLWHLAKSLVTNDDMWAGLLYCYTHETITKKFVHGMNCINRKTL